MSEKPLSRFVQPIATPGGRLLHAIPLNSVRSSVLRGSRRTLNKELPLIPFIDFLLCIVLFLLASFSASGELSQDPNIDSPTASNVESVPSAPIVSLSGTRILVNGTPAGSTRAIVESGTRQTIPELRDLLQAQRNLWLQVHVGREFPGVAILQIDSKASALVVKSVFETVATAQYPNVSFMVGPRSDGDLPAEP
jgi:biopolymer transport protein ExbD